jgi:hypothetical protein
LAKSSLAFAGPACITVRRLIWDCPAFVDTLKL